MLVVLLVLILYNAYIIGQFELKFGTLGGIIIKKKLIIGGDNSSSDYFL